MKRILLLATKNDDTKIFLWCLRQAGYLGFAVGHASKNTHVKFSPLCRQFFNIPEEWTLEEKSSEIVDLLKEIVQKNDIDMLLPTGFESIKFLSHYRAEIEAFVPLIPLPDQATIDTLGNKLNFANYCRDHGIPHPKVYHLPDYRSFKSIEKDVIFPVVTKPLASSASRGIYKFERLNALDDYLKKSTSPGVPAFPLLLQEYIPGKDYCFYAYANKGRLNAWTILKFIEIPREGDNKPLLWIQFQRNDDIFAIGRDIVAQSDYSGPINIDMRVDATNKHVYALEVNPRFGAKTFYSACDGVNFADVAIRCVHDQTVVKEPNYSNRIWGSPHRLLPLILKHRQRKYIDYASKHTFFQVRYFLLDKYYAAIGKIREKINTMVQ
jgi:predicted ATP-grasp superfamily ATP-dependent carboligase